MPTVERVVAIEEHFWIPELRDRYSGPRGISAHTPARQLDDLGRQPAEFSQGFHAEQVGELFEGGSLNFVTATRRIPGSTGDSARFSL